MTYTPQVMTDTKIWCASVDMTGWSNRTDLAVSAEQLDRTTFGSNGYKEYTGGLLSLTGSIEGFWQAGDSTMPDDVLTAQLGNAIPVTWIPTLGTTPGDAAYLTKVMEAKYDLSAQIGDLVAFTVDLSGTAPIARGQVAHTNTARTSSGTGTAVQIGAVGSTQRLYANLHVFAVTGTSPALTVTIQSASTSSFGSPTSQITLGGLAAVTGIATNVVGAITDTWYRVLYSVGGTSPSFTFGVSLGVAGK